MTGKVTRIENLIKKLNKADFCKVVNSAIRLRAANEADIADIISSLQETIAEAKIPTPAATPSADGDSSIDQAGSPAGNGSQPKRKRSERTDPAVVNENPDDGGLHQKCGKRRRHYVTFASDNSDKLTKAMIIKPNPEQDLCNFWSLCKSLRRVPREEEKIQPHVPWVEQLPKLFDNAEKRFLDAKCKVAQHRLEWRLLAMDVATIYVEERLHEEERKSEWRALGHRVHATRDTTLDLLTKQVFGDAVNMYKLSDKDPRRKRVENWLRIGCPLLTFRNHFGFMGLIAPGMRITHNAFKAKRTGEMETPFVKYLITTFESSKEKLSFVSDVMETWVRWGTPPYPAFMIEDLSETGVRTARNLSLEYWAQPALSLNGLTDGLDGEISGAVPAITESPTL